MVKLFTLKDPLPQAQNAKKEPQQTFQICANNDFNLTFICLLSKHAFNNFKILIDEIILIEIDIFFF